MGVLLLCELAVTGRMNLRLPLECEEKMDLVPEDLVYVMREILVGHCTRNESSSWIKLPSSNLEVSSRQVLYLHERYVLYSTGECLRCTNVLVQWERS
jgi:hypothetical protein